MRFSRALAKERRNVAILASLGAAQAMVLKAAYTKGFRALVDILVSPFSPVSYRADSFGFAIMSVFILPPGKAA
jgi:hypothetical protein